MTMCPSLSFDLPQRLRSLTLACLCLLIGPVGSLSAQVAPQAGYLFPPSIPIGQTSDVQLGGYDFSEDMQWFVHDDRVRLEVLGPRSDYLLPPPPYWIGPRSSTDAPPIPREVPGRIHVDPAATEGLVRWQVANANGASTTAKFYLSRTPDLIESRSRDLPQVLPSLPVAVCGRLSRLTEVDRYQFTTKQDGPISIDLMARRLGSDFHGMLQVHDSAGQPIANVADTLGRDLAVTFAAKAHETYTISLNDLDFRGDRAYVYRLAVTTGPRVLCTLPAVGQRGSTADVEFVGPGLISGTSEVDTLTKTVTFPSDPAVDTFTYSLETTFGPVAVHIPLGDVPEVVSPAITDKATHLPTTGGFTSRMSEQQIEQRFTWQAEPNEFWSFDLQSQSIGGSLDVAIVILGPDGKELAVNDDLANSTDAGLTVRTTVSGLHSCLVRSLSPCRGAADELFRLHIAKRPPGFSLMVTPTLNLPLGEKKAVKITATRHGGFTGPITVSATGLPDGVLPQGEWVIGEQKSDLNITLEAAADAAVVAALLQFQGTAMINGIEVTQLATTTTPNDLCPVSLSEQPLSTMLLAMTMPAPFDVLVIDRERQRDVPRGSTCLADLEIVRHVGFQGAVTIEMTGKQSRNRQGIRGIDLHVPPETSRVQYAIFLPEWLALDLTRRVVVQGVATIADPQGNLRQVNKKGDARITMILEGALLKLDCLAQESIAKVGSTIDLPIHISRSVKLPQPTTIELVVPDELIGVVSAEPLVLPAGIDTGSLRLATKNTPALLGQWSLRLRATAMQEEHPVVSETTLAIEFANP
ncbi:MAG: hypothetical protein R3C01_17780 [Planctomycetaceae bacterium]